MSKTLFIALASVDYEGGDILGVFNTKRRALNRLDRYKAKYYFDNIWVKEIKLNEDMEENI